MKSQYFSEKVIDFSEKLTGFSEKAVGFSQKVLYYSEKVLSFSEKAVGFSEKVVDFSEKAVGFFQKAVGFSEKNWFPGKATGIILLRRPGIRQKTGPLEVIASKIRSHFCYRRLKKSAVKSTIYN